MSEERTAKRKAKWKKLGVDILFVIPGCFIGAFGSICILLPNGLSSGGITGISRILQQFIPLNFSIIYYGMAILIFVACILLLGFREARKILPLTILYPAVLVLMEHLDFSLLETPDTLLAAIFLGIMYGISTGLFFTRGYSSGGTDTIAKIIKIRWLPHVGISKILLVVDVIIIIGAGFLFGRDVALYALITQLVMSKTVEYVMYGFDSKVVRLDIFTDKYEEVAHYILNEINRGVSSASITGGYTGQVRDQIITLCSPRESMLIKRFVAGVDKTAFISVMKVDTVWGSGIGFTSLDN